MKILVHNPSSPGASFTDNTNSVLLKIYDWIKDNQEKVIPFIEFRRALESQKQINDNNNRNIFPLLKNCGFVSYEKNSDLVTKKFFTNQGMALVKLLGLIQDLKEAGATDENANVATLKAQNVLEEIVFKGLCKLLKESDANYNEPFYDTISFLLKYGKIDKKEFGYLMDARVRYSNVEDALNVMKDNINSYRSGILDIEIVVEVRNDNGIRESTSRTHRKEPLSFLTAFGYYVSLLQQAGILGKEASYYVVKSGKIVKLQELGGCYHA